MIISMKNKIFLVNVYLLVSSADNICKQYQPDISQNVRPELSPNCLTFLMILLNESSENNPLTTKSMNIYPACKE